MLLSGKDKVKVEFIESYIKHGAGDYEWNDNHGELIRCKDCIYKENNEPVSPLIWCTIHEFGREDDYYCADAVKKENSKETDMTKYKVPVQSLIDHIKTACDVDPWAKQMAEELLKGVKNADN